MYSAKKNEICKFDFQFYGKTQKIKFEVLKNSIGAIAFTSLG